MKYKFTCKLSIPEVLVNMSDGKLTYITLDNPKVRELADNLTREGYSASEFLVFFRDKYVGIGGTNQLTYVNKWTSPKIWIEFVEYKTYLKNNDVGRKYLLRLDDAEMRMTNKLSTVMDILTTDIVDMGEFSILGRLEMAARHRSNNTVVGKWLSDNWDMGIQVLRGLPEYLPYTLSLTALLIDDGQVACHA